MTFSILNDESNHRLEMEAANKPQEGDEYRPQSTSLQRSLLGLRSREAICRRQVPALC